MINSKQRSKLRSQAHHLKPAVIVGKSGLTDGTFTSINQALDSHELIKIKFNSSKDQKKSFIENIDKELSSYIVGDIGHTIIIYRRHEDPKKRKYLK